MLVPRVAHFTPRRFNNELRKSSRVKCLNTDLGDRVRRAYQPTFNCERSDASENIPTIGSGIHSSLVDAHLREKKFYVCVVIFGRAYDRHLTGQRMSSTKAIYLTRIGRTHNSQQEIIPFSLIRG